MGLWKKVKNLWNRVTGKSSGGSRSSGKTTTRSSAPTQRYSGTSYKDGGTGFVNSSRYSSRKEEEEKERERQRKRLNAYKASNKIIAEEHKIDKEELKPVSRKQLIADRKNFDEATKKNGVKKDKVDALEKARAEAKAYGNEAKALVEKREKKQKEKKELKEKYKLTDADYETVEEKFPNMDETGNWDGTYKTAKVKKLTPKGYEKKLKGDKFYRNYESLGRGLVGGATLGATELAFKKGGIMTPEEEEVYQRNKSKGLELAGNIAGSMVTFSGAGKGAESLTGKAVGSKAGQGAVKKLAETKGLQALAKRAGDKAVKKGLTSAATKEVVGEIANQKAKKIISSLIEGGIVDATAGLVYDVNTASANYEVGSKEWWKDLGLSAALNTGIAGGSATLNALGAKSATKSALETLGKNADEVAEGAVKNADNYKVGLNRKRKTDVRLPNEVDEVAAKKASQLDVIQKSNPMTDDIHTGVRNTNDILTFDEAVRDVGDYTPDYTAKDMAKARETGTVTVYSSKPIEDGAFVTPSKMEATDYAGGGKVYSKEVPVDDVAWLTEGEGQYAPIKRASDNVTADAAKNANNAVENTVKKPADVMQGYQSTGSKKKISEAKKRAKELLSSGDERAAREEIERAVDDIVKNTTTREELDPTFKALQEDIRASRIKVSDFDKTDVGYTSGGYNEFRKNNFGGLNLTNDGASVDDVWAELKERHGNLLPDDIDTQSDRLQYLANFAKAKGAKGIELADDEARYLKEELTNAMLADVGIGANEQTVKSITADVMNDSFSREELAELERRYVTDDIAGEGSPPRKSVDDFATDETVDTRALGIEPDTSLDAARARAEELADGAPIRTADNVTADAAKSTTKTTQGVKDARNAYTKETGETFSKQTEGVDFDTKWEAWKTYEKSQGRDAERKLSRAAASQFSAIDDDFQKGILDDLIKNSDTMEYNVIHHTEMYEQAAKRMQENPERWIDKLNDIVETGEWEGSKAPEYITLAQYISATLDATKYESEEAAQAAAELAKTSFTVQKMLSSTGGQTLNLRRTFVHLTPDAKMQSTIDDLADILGSSIGFNKKHRKAMKGLDRFEKEHYIRGVLMEDSKLKECVQKVVNAKSEEAVGDAYTEMLYEFNKHNVKSGFDVLQQWRYLSMLGNFKTHNRNIIGSAFFAPIRQISNAIRAGIEAPIEKALKSGGYDIELNIKHGGLSPEAVLETWRKNPKSEAGIAAKDALERISPSLFDRTNELTKYGTKSHRGRSKRFMGKAIDWLSDFNGNLLTKEDEFFKKRAFRENYIKSYNRLLNDGVEITDKVKKLIEAEAIQEAQIATFNEYNEFAKALSNFTKNATDANAEGWKRWTARGVNALIPFEKVPANLGKQAINYSPLGIARGFAGIKKAAKSGDSVMLNQAIDRLASGVTGTGIFGLGMLLGKTTDMFTTNTGKNDPAAKFKKGQGMQNYSVNFYDPETGKGTSMTLDWLVPAAPIFFAGIEMANQMKENDYSAVALALDWSTVMSRLTEPVMESSFLSALHGALETMRGGYGGDDDKGWAEILLRETAQSYVNSIIPTALGQVARTAYKADKQITGETDREYWLNTLKSKTGLAADNAVTRKLGIEPLGADTDLYGNVKNEKNSGKDYAVSALKNFLSPTNIQQIDISATDREKLRQYEEAVKNGADPNEMAYLFPKKQYKKQFSRGNLNVNMTNQELSAYNQAKTTGGSEAMRSALEGIMFNRYDVGEDGKTKVLVNGYTKAQKAKLIKDAENWSVREVEEWLYNNDDFKNATEAEQKKVITRLWNLNRKKAEGAQRVGEQAVIKAQGGDVNEYNFNNELSEKKREALQPYVNSGVLSYEEAVDFARNAGKTYYYQDEDGGSSKTYYNKTAMIEYLVDKGYSYEKAEALYNSFKASNAKAYNGNSLSRIGGRRRSYGGYRRRRGGGGGSKLVSTAKINQSAYKATKSGKTIAETVGNKKVTPPSKKKTASKATPPKVKFKEYKI